uniref:Uncharacterized protein n=1 Tax=Melopsittacus undulatus TaxID=13146 RepID=A0A8V5H905_MELUD
MLLLLLQVLASCLWLGHSEVVTSFESSCPQFFFQNTPPNEALVPQNPAWICQRYNNRYYFATLYDKTRRIPVYSAYIYQPASCGRPKTWLVEPEVSVLSSYPKMMKTEQSLSKEFKITLEEIGKHQAVLQDYTNLNGLNRGHLNPCCHQPDSDSKAATFTLTNIVPQNEKLNGGAWSIYEQQTMIKNTEGCKKTYVVVGAVPGNNYIANGRVNKPSYIWASACCEVNAKVRKTWAVIAENDRDEVESLTLGELEDKLTKLYGRSQVSLFDSACPRK